MLSACPGCGVVLPEVDGPVHAYLTSSPACWAAFGAVLAADLGDARRMRVHQLVVDAYAASHPGADGRRERQSVGLHLMTLCLFLERGADPARGTALHAQMIGRPAYSRLHPLPPGPLTVVDVPLTGPVEELERAARAWGAQVWARYAADHGTVRHWLTQCGF